MSATREPARRAIVIGGSISGLYAALLLMRHNWHVDVHERTPGELAGRGAGIVAQPDLRAGLAAAGIGDIGEVGVEVATRVLLDASGRTLFQHPCPQTVTSWERVHRLLRARLPDRHYHAGSELQRIEIAEPIGIAHFADGRRVEADLIVGADGFRSTVRQQLFPATRFDYAGYVAWRGLVDEAGLSAATHAAIFWQFAFGLPPGEQCIGYPVTGAAEGLGDDLTPGRLRYNFVWYRPADETTDLQRLLTDDSGRVHALSIPPPLISTRARAEMRDAADRLLAPPFREVIALAPQPFLQPIYDLESDALCRGPVAIIGDAAFLARPHVAAGVIKAVDDVLALVAALDAEGPDGRVAAALRRFEAERLPVGRRIIARARAMGANYRPASMAGGAPRLSDADVDYARAVVEDTALTTFLREGQG